MRDDLVVLPTHLTWVKVNGGRGFAHMSNWDSDDVPVVGQHVLGADGGSERLEAEIVAIRSDGVLVLEFAEFAELHQTNPESVRPDASA